MVGRRRVDSGYEIMEVNTYNFGELEILEKIHKPFRVW